PDPKTQHHCQKILDSVDRLTALSQDVLDYAKVREPNREKVDLQTFLGAILEPLVPRAAEMGVTLRTEGGPCIARLDPARFTRVVENLVTNALDAMTDMSGEVVLSWGRVTGGVQMCVRDNGRGIPKKLQKRIFEPFFSYGKKRGTGLGMATVRKIIDEHGGSLEFTSEEGHGTEVHLVLPDVQPGEHPAQDESTGKHRALRTEAP
ncbi:MAG TPA: HAMP domain-containing sensor histidine kinase, partial [Holophagaceae bacterium]